MNFPYLSSLNVPGQPSFEYDHLSGYFRPSVPLPNSYTDPTMSDTLISYKAISEGNPMSHSSISLGNNTLTYVGDMPVAREAVANLHRANGTAGRGGLDAIYGDGYSEALVQYHLIGQISPWNPHYNTILQQEQAAQIREIQNQQTYQGIVDVWNNSSVSGLENIVSDSSVGGIENFNRNFVNNLESIFNF